MLLVLFVVYFRMVWCVGFCCLLVVVYGLMGLGGGVLVVLVIGVAIELRCWLFVVLWFRFVC